MLALGTIYLVWGSSFLFTKIAVENLPPALFAGIRFVTAGGFVAFVRGLYGGGVAARHVGGIARIARRILRRGLADPPDRMATCDHRRFLHGVRQQWLEYLVHSIS